MDEGHAHGAPETGGLDHQPRVRGAGGERGHLALHGRPVRGPPSGGHLAPVHYRDAQPAAHPLEQGLVHPERGRRDTGARVGQAGGIEQRLDRAVLAERPVEADDHHRGRIHGREPVEGGADGDRALAPERGRVVVRGRGPVVAAVVGREPPPRAVEADQDLADVRAGIGQGGRDGGARDDRDIVLGRRAAEQDDDGWQGTDALRADTRAAGAASSARSIAAGGVMPAMASRPSRRGTRSRTPARRHGARRRPLGRGPPAGGRRRPCPSGR